MALESLRLNGNKLQTLDVSDCGALKSLFAYDNELSSMVLGIKSAMSTLHVAGNRLRSVDLSGCGALTTLIADNNELT